MRELTVFTSANVAYLPKARQMGRSVKALSPDTWTVLMLCDEIPGWMDVAAEPFDEILPAADLGIPDFPAWAFRHNVVEFCTGVKGPTLRTLLDRGDSRHVMYLDPDTVSFQPPEETLKLLGDASVGLTPHITSPEPTRRGVIDTEMSCLKHGIYNLGFLLVRNDDDGNTFARWWEDRLLHWCRDDIPNGLFTDQRWVDLAPAIFPFVAILRDDRLNVATWNLEDRGVTIGPGGAPHVNGRPLIFYHFSGTGKGAHEMIRTRYHYDNADLEIFERSYYDRLDAAGLPEGAGRWAYGFYGNGAPIPDQHRRWYRDDPQLQEQYPDPYDTGAHPSWYDEAVARSAADTPAQPAPLDPAQVARAAAALVDPAWYGAQVGQQLDAAGALAHFGRYGWLWGAWPNAFFDTTFYIGQGPGVDQYMADHAPTTLLHHYVSVGGPAGWRPSPLFDDRWYRAAYADVAAAVERGDFASGFEHYLRHGAKEGRSPSAEFSEERYLAAYPDVRQAVESPHDPTVNGYHHYLRHGRAERRIAG